MFGEIYFLEQKSNAFSKENRTNHPVIQQNPVWIRCFERVFIKANFSPKFSFLKTSLLRSANRCSFNPNSGITIEFVRSFLRISDGLGAVETCFKFCAETGEEIKIKLIHNTCVLQKSFIFYLLRSSTICLMRETPFFISASPRAYDNRIA